MSNEPHKCGEMGTWVEVQTETRMAKWKRRAWCCDDGEVFVPAVLCDSETVAMLAASFDGTPIVVDAKHLYLPVSWLCREYPDMADRLNELADKVRTTAMDGSV